MVPFLLRFWSGKEEGRKRMGQRKEPTEPTEPRKPKGERGRERGERRRSLVTLLYSNSAVRPSMKVNTPPKKNPERGGRPVADL